MSQPRHPAPTALRALLAACGLAASLGAAQAAPIVFGTAPFLGSTADPGDGVRTVFGGAERTLAGFDVASDRFEFDSLAFGLAGPLSFVNASAAALPGAGARVIVLQDSDNDANPLTAFNAGSAANLIADAVADDIAGFFVYWNSALGVNRLVYSTNLSSRTADLAILARIQSPTGADAIAALPTFTADNFAVSTVSEPGSLGLLAAGLGVMAWRRRAAATAGRAR